MLHLTAGHAALHWREQLRVGLAPLAPAVRRYGPAIAAAFALSWVVVAAWWALLPVARTIEVTIPVGTADRVARGERVGVLPDTLTLRIGDHLMVHNEDVGAHRIGSMFIAPGALVRQTVGPELTGAAALTCTFHPSGLISVAPRARPGIRATIWPTLLAAVPISWALIIAIAVGSRLRDDG